jgi:hypothetical protein
MVASGPAEKQDVWTHHHPFLVPVRRDIADGLIEVKQLNAEVL